MPKCTSCGTPKAETDFPVSGNYKGRKKRRKVCKECWAGKNRNLDTPVRRRIRRVNRILRWPAIMLVVVFGTYTHDYVSGTSRICFYATVYGERAVTLDALTVCPMTWEWEDE